MTPLTLLVPMTLANLLTANRALSLQIAAVEAEFGYTLPVIPSSQIILSLADADTIDRRQQISYPRIAVYADRVVNNLREKFRTLSGTVSATIAVSASADLVDQVEQWIHYYVEAVTNVLRQNIGDWGNGMFFPGTYDVQLQPPKPGGSGFVQTATVTCIVSVSSN
jgi:hypothetical protein